MTRTVGRRKFRQRQRRETKMILDDVSIKARKLVRNGRPKNYRKASYDLTVGGIVTPNGEVVDEYLMEPQGMTKVISAELVDLPKDITGYVHVKTGLCNQGVLALNIGIVDPGFSGPLQSALLNFGKAKHRLMKGDVFSRITFHEQMADDSEFVREVRSVDQVQADAKQHVDKYLAKDFLNFSKTVKKAADRAVAGYRSTLLWYAPLLALLLTIFTLLLNFSNMWRLERYMNVDSLAAELSERAALADQVAALEQALDELRQELEQVRTPIPAQQQPPAAP
jgi:deoxycytidine triphosphate deaminase